MIHLLILHFNFQFSKSVKSHPSYIFVNLTSPFSKISLSQNAQKSPKKVTQNRQKVINEINREI